MLQSFRENAQSIVVKIIVGFIIITFALFGVDSLVGLAGRADAPVTVNGADISERQIAEGIDLQRRQLMAQMGENADPALLDDALLRDAVINNLIERELLRQAAKEQGLGVSDQFLDSAILATKEFQVDGSFDRNQFEALLRNVGMTPMMYRDYLRSETLMAQGRSGLMASAFMLDSELERITQLDQQTRSFKYYRVAADEIKEAISIADSEIETYYQNNRSLFKSEEQVAVQYVALDKQAIASGIEVDEAELRTEYENYIAAYEADEAREASHILVAINDERDEAAALERVLELMKRIEAGESFAEVARDASDDPGSAGEGGHLGVVEAGVMVPEFEQALFALEQGEMSEPVRTDFGYHLIKLHRIEGAEPPSFEEVRPQLVSQLQMQKAESEFVALSEQLDDLRFSSSDLMEVSEVLNLEIKETDFFGREGGESELTQNPRFLSAAFSNEVLVNRENSELIELDPDHILVLHLKDHQPVRQLTLDEVREQIVAQLTREKAAALAEEKADALLERARQQNFASVEADTGAWSEYINVGRGATEPSPQVVKFVFQMPKPESTQASYASVPLPDGGVGLVRLQEVAAGEADFNEQQLKGMRDLLANRLGQGDYRNLLANLKASAEIERR